MFRFGIFASSLFDEAGENGGGGGGGGDEKKDVPLTLESIKSLFETTLETKLTERFNTYDKSVKKELEKITAKVTTPPAADGKKEGDNKDGKTPDPFAEARFTELTELVNSLKAENTQTKKDAENVQIDSAVRQALSKHPWKEGGADIAYDFYRGKVAKADDGALTIGGVPLAKYISEHVPRSPFTGMLESRQIGGSGAEKNQGGGGGKTDIQIEDINPKMSKEKQAEVGKRLAQLVREHNAS